MREAMIILGPLTLLLLVLAWPPDDNTTPPPRTRPTGRHTRTPQNTATTVTVRRWVASDHESRWHLPGERLSTTKCGHHMRGPIRRYLGMRAPSGDGRTACEPCHHAAGLPVDSPYRPSARLTLVQPREVNGTFAHIDETKVPFTPEPIEWPTLDPDGEDLGTDTIDAQATTPLHALAA